MTPFPSTKTTLPFSLPNLTAFPSPHRPSLKFAWTWNQLGLRSPIPPVPPLCRPQFRQDGRCPRLVDDEEEGVVLRANGRALILTLMEECVAGGQEQEQQPSPGQARAGGRKVRPKFALALHFFSPAAKPQTGPEEDSASRALSLPTPTPTLASDMLTSPSALQRTH